MGEWEGVRLGGEMGEVWWGKSEGEVGVVGLRKFIARQVLSQCSGCYHLSGQIRWFLHVHVACLQKETFTNNFYYSSVYIVDTRVNMIF